MNLGCEGCWLVKLWAVEIGRVGPMKPVGFGMGMKYKKGAGPLLLAVSANAVQEKPAMRMRFCWLSTPRNRARA